MYAAWCTGVDAVAVRRHIHSGRKRAIQIMDSVVCHFYVACGPFAIQYGCAAVALNPSKVKSEDPDVAPFDKPHVSASAVSVDFGGAMNVGLPGDWRRTGSTLCRGNACRAGEGVGAGQNVDGLARFHDAVDMSERRAWSGLRAGVAVASSRRNIEVRRRTCCWTYSYSRIGGNRGIVVAARGYCDVELRAGRWRRIQAATRDDSGG